MSRSHEGKQLQTRLKKINVDIEAVKTERSAVDKKLSDLAKQKQAVENQLSSLAQRELRVTEHALLRICERKFGIPIDKLEESLKAAVRPMAKLGSGKYPIGDGLRAVVKDNIIVTVEPA